MKARVDDKSESDNESESDSASSKVVVVKLSDLPLD